MTTVISVENLSKSYRLGQIGSGTFSNDLKLWWAKARGKPNPLLKIGEADHGNRDGEELMALRDVSFTVQQGEVLGIIGKNGAGKSTLLKILSRVTAPTSGRIKVKGRIASLLEVGTGFHPELTGRENIYLNGAILGMTRQEVTRKFDEIVDFAGVEKFIDTPVKRYSSGMHVRLAFAVAAHLEPEILVVDEVLAVGDAEFQQKCLGKMGDVASQGRTVLFVSHNMAAISSLCLKSMWVQSGSIRAIGDTGQIVKSYLSNLETHLTADLSSRQDRRGDGSFKFSAVKCETTKTEKNIISSGDDVDIFIHYRGRENFNLRDCNFTIIFSDANGNPLFSCSTHLSKGFQQLPSEGVIVCHMDKLPLFPGRYYLLLIGETNGRNMADRIENAFAFDVQAGDFWGTGKLPERANKNGPLLVHHNWHSLK